MQCEVRVEVAKGFMMICMLDWTVRRETLTYTGWQSRDTEMARTCSRSGCLRIVMEMC